MSDITSLRSVFLRAKKGRQELLDERNMTDAFIFLLPRPT
jgi:hypothetical protein